MNITTYPQITFAYFDCSLDCVKNFLEIHYKHEREIKKISVIDSKYNPRDVFVEFEQLKQIRRNSGQHCSQKAFFYNPSCDSSKTIMVSNLFDGWYTLCNIVSRKLACKCYLLEMCEYNVSEPKNCLTYIDGFAITRVVYVLKEGKRWLFFEQDNPLWFEEADHYKQRIKKKRLSREILIGYCYKLGLPINNFDFWETDKNGIYLESLL